MVGKLNEKVVTYFVPGKLYRAKKEFSKRLLSESKTTYRKIYWKKNDIVILTDLSLEEKWGSVSYADPHVEMIQKFSFTIISDGKFHKMEGGDEKSLFEYFELVENDK